MTPASGVRTGGYAVTIAGTRIGSGNDITAVLFGTLTATITSQTASQVIVTVPAAAADGAVTITVRSTSQGDISLANGFSYTAPPAGIISAVTPNSAPVTAGVPVTIAGSNLGSGNDITAVLFGTATATITSQSATQVVVTLPVAQAVGAVAVVIRSVSQGEISLANGFTYTAPPAGSISSVSPNTATTAGGIAVTIAGTNLGSGSDITAVLFGTTAATITSQTATQVVVTVPAAAAAGAVTVTVRSSSSGDATLANGFTYTAVRGIRSLQPPSGPLTGGNTITILGTDLGSGNDISAVLLNGVAATIVTQSAEQVTA